MSPVPGSRPVDPYVLGIADRMMTLAALVAGIRSRRPPLERIHEVRHILRERRKNGALEEVLAVVAGDISPKNRRDLRRQLWDVEEQAACIVNGVESFLEEVPPLTPAQQKGFARRAKRHPDRETWLADLTTRARDAGLAPESLYSIQEHLGRLPEVCKRAEHNLRYLARRLRTQFEAPLADVIEGDDGFDGPLVSSEPAELSVDQNGDSQVLTLTVPGSTPQCLRYSNGAGREDLVRRSTGPGRVLIAAALGESPVDVSSDALRRARRAVAESTRKQVELRGTVERPVYSCRVLLSPLLQRLVG